MEEVARQATAFLSLEASALPDAVTAHDQAQELLRLREAELAAIVASSDDAIISKRLDGTITTWNHAAERLYGYTAAEIIGRPIATIVPADRRAELVEIMARLKRGERIAHHETVRVHKDGTRIDVSVSISPMFDEVGHIVGASKIARDIRQRRALERQKQEFVEMVAHDLGSPLTVIKGYAQLLQRRPAGNDPAIGKILAEVGRMERLLRDLREVTRLDAGQLELRLAPVDLIALVRDRVAQAAFAVADGLRLRCEVPDAPVIGAWDYDRVEQVLTNLLDNALKYAPCGAVVVRVETGETEALVAVQDHGPGLTAEQLHRVFERFTRLPQTAASTAGTGLGLFISKRLIEAHGGRLWADSVPGQGTTFSFALPLTPSHSAARNATPAGEPGLDSQRSDA
jgi:PAS domain S-box-containing protein